MKMDFRRVSRFIGDLILQINLLRYDYVNLVLIFVLWADDYGARRWLVRRFLNPQQSLALWRLNYLLIIEVRKFLLLTAGVFVIMRTLLLSVL